MKCKGCMTSTKLRIYDLNKCVIKNNSPKKSCPCYKCLVKTSCSVQCQDFKDVIKSIFNIKMGYNYKGVVSDTFPHINSHARPYYHRIIGEDW